MDPCTPRFDAAAASLMNARPEDHASNEQTREHGSLSRIAAHAAAAGVDLSTLGAPTAAPASGALHAVLRAEHIDTDAQRRGAALPPSVEQAMQQAVDAARRQEHVDSDALPACDGIPASPIRSDATRDFFDRYLEAQPRAWNPARTEQLTQRGPPSRGAAAGSFAASQSFHPRVVHITPEMAERLKIAKATIDLVRALLCHGPSNQVRNLTLNGWEPLKRGDLARHEFEKWIEQVPRQRGGCEMAHLNAYYAVKWEAGRCAEHAAVAMAILCQLPELRDCSIDVVANGRVDHMLVVIRGACADEDIVVDAWSVLPVPCLKEDAARELGVIAERGGKNASIESAVNVVMARKPAGEIWPEFDLQGALAARPSRAEAAHRGVHTEPDEPSGHPHDERYNSIDGLYNGDPHVRFARRERGDESASAGVSPSTHENAIDRASESASESANGNTNESTSDGASKDTSGSAGTGGSEVTSAGIGRSFGFRNERLPNGYLKSLSSLPAPSLSASTPTASSND